MSLDNIQLSPKLVKQLYSNTLISLDNHQPVAAEKCSETLSFLGENLQQILILVNQSEQKFLADDELDFLTKILKACDLSLADVAILNIHDKNNLQYELINEKFSPKLVMSFGFSPDHIGYPINFPAYKLQTWNHQTFLHASELSVLKNDVNEKRNFWNTLKVYFNK